MLFLRYLVFIIITLLIIMGTNLRNIDMLKISNVGIKFIKEAEGFSPLVYTCTAGKSTIGYGHVVQKTESVIYNRAITVAEGESILEYDLQMPEAVVNGFVKVPLTQNQYDALVSLIFNVGSGNFQESRGLKYLNKGDYHKAAIEFFDSEIGFVKSDGKISQGLINRRAKEWDLWVS